MEGLANANLRVLEGCKNLPESGVRISYSSALTHRKRGLDFGLGGLSALLNDSVRVWLGRCPGSFEARERAGPPFLSVLEFRGALNPLKR